jgi:hypothetical protein
MNYCGDLQSGGRPAISDKKVVAIVQSNYIPWKGYFDLINAADEFILFDDVQFTRRDWRNRNRIKTPNGLIWLTIPVESKGGYFNKIKDIAISDPKWSRRHWTSITQNYSKARYFRDYKDVFQDLYLGSHDRFLSQINFRFLEILCALLGIKTKLSWSMDHPMVEGKTERLVDLCRQVEAQEYISGPSAKAYIDEELFRAQGIMLRYMDYTGYPEYDQLFPPFEHRVSVIDLLFNTGPEAARYMKSF